MVCHVGVYAVQLAPLAAALQLNPARLGVAVTCAALAGLVTLFGGGFLADRLGRRTVLLTGFLGTGMSFVLLGMNTVGSDLEAMTGRKIMTGLHAGFSAGACIGALASALLLTAGLGFRSIYLGLAVLLLLAAMLTSATPLPKRPANDHEQPASSKPGRIWRIHAVLFAMALIAVTFFGEGALESFLAVYLQQALAATILLTGIGVAAYHAASLTGRLVATKALHRWGERRLITVAGLLASAGITTAVISNTPLAAITGLLVVGFAVSPIVPVALSLAGRSARGQGRTSRRHHHSRWLRSLRGQPLHRRRTRHPHQLPTRHLNPDPHHTDRGIPRQQMAQTQCTKRQARMKANRPDRSARVGQPGLTASPRFRRTGRHHHRWAAPSSPSSTPTPAPVIVRPALVDLDPLEASDG